MGYMILCKMCSQPREDCECHLNKPLNKISDEPMYKPIKEFAWKDASEEEIKENSIKAYEKYTFKD